MTSVAKTNQNINFDPTNFNKRFESSNITPSNSSNIHTFYYNFINSYSPSNYSKEPPFDKKRLIKFNADFESNDNSSNQPSSSSQPVQYSSNNNLIKQTLLDMKDLLMNIINLIASGNNPIPYISNSPYNRYIFSLFLISFGCLLLLTSGLFKKSYITYFDLPTSFLQQGQKYE